MAEAQDIILSVQSKGICLQGLSICRDDLEEAIMDLIRANNNTRVMTDGH
jgi:hypothetical protein